MILCGKIKRMGVFGKLGIWIHNFLSERTQVVLANGARSSEARVTGIPQGTVLGPLLFLMMINDLRDSVTDSFVSIFADDTRATKIVKEAEDIEKLQDDITTVYKSKRTEHYAFQCQKV